MTGRLLRQVLEKFFKSPIVQDARVQVCLPNGEYYDIKGIQLMENKLIGVRETHRLVITISPEAKPLGPLAPKLYEGRQIQDLLTLGHVPVAAVAEGWTKVQEHLVNVT
jgi:hypothetical protein